MTGNEERDGEGRRCYCSLSLQRVWTFCFTTEAQLKLETVAGRQVAPASLPENVHPVIISSHFLGELLL